MYIAKIPNRSSPPAYLLRESCRQGKKVSSHTIANVTDWTPMRRKAVGRALKGEFDGLSGEVVSGRVFGTLYVLKAIAERGGIVKAVGRGREGKLTLFMTLARVVHQGSRLSAVRWARNHAVREVVGVGGFDEDELYGALDWACGKQEEIEDRLYRRYVREAGGVPALVLYDVTSAYLEGEQNELGDWGHPRDMKRGKKQIVIGLLTGPDGEPLGVKVYPGNRSDPTTVADQVRVVKERYGIEEVVFVGDRGMVKAKGKEALREAGLRYITAITDPQIRKLLKSEVIQLEMFDEELQEAEAEGKRYVVCRNEATRRKEMRRREDKLKRLGEIVAKRNEYVGNRRRAKVETGVRGIERWVARHKVGGFVEVKMEGREVKVEIDEAGKEADGALDGCYVLETDVAREVMGAKDVRDRYMDLQEVERDFRTLKTTLLEVRPIFVRKEERTRAHVFIAMLALKVVREMRRCLVREYGTTDDDKLAVTVEDALSALGRLCLETCEMEDGSAYTRLPRPDAEQMRILKALGTPLPRM